MLTWNMAEHMFHRQDFAHEYSEMSRNGFCNFNEIVISLKCIGCDIVATRKIKLQNGTFDVESDHLTLGFSSERDQLLHSFKCSAH